MRYLVLLRLDEGNIIDKEVEAGNRKEAGLLAKKAVEAEGSAVTVQGVTREA